MTLPLHAIILTLNEEKHLARCIASIKDQCSGILVVDSGSTDGTADIATSLGAEVISNRWVNYATQLNFAIDHLAGRGGWLLRIDADEVLDEDSRGTFAGAIESAAEVFSGLLVQRRIHFMGRRMRFGGIEPSWQLRLWQNGKGHCEQRWMDEHVMVEGEIRKSDLILTDINLNSLTWWTQKHNSYASREAVDVVLTELQEYAGGEQGQGDLQMGQQARARRRGKQEIFQKLPSGLRSGLYFAYRYFFRLGFLDGAPGFYFHALQGFWYRLLVDAKLKNIADRRAAGMTLAQAVMDETGIDLDAVEKGGGKGAR